MFLLLLLLACSEEQAYFNACMDYYDQVCACSGNDGCGSGSQADSCAEGIPTRANIKEFRCMERVYAKDCDAIYDTGAVVECFE